MRLGVKEAYTPIVGAENCGWSVGAMCVLRERGLGNPVVEKGEAYRALYRVR